MKQKQQSANVDSGASVYFFTKYAPKKNMEPMVPHIQVRIASGRTMKSAGTCYLVIHKTPSDFPTTSHVMPGFQENLVDVGLMCDNDCTVTVSKHAVIIYRPTETPIITGWRENSGPRLWRMSVLTNPEDVPPLSSSPAAHKNPLQVFSAYDFPSVEAFVWYFHAAANLPVRNT